MKKIFSVIIFLSSLFSVCAQAPAPSGLPAPYSTGYYRIGWVQTDSGFIYALRDTTVRSKYIGLTFFWADNGHDSSSWIWNGRRYVKQLNSEDTLLGRFLITPSFLFSQGFLKVATDTIWRTPGKDSLQFTIGGRYHSLAAAANSGSVFNQDSIKHRFVDTGSVARNLYTISWDSVNKKWILAAPGSGGGGSGTVTTVGFTAGNGFTGNFANPSTTPNLTIGTSVTGLIFGNGTAISNATVSSPLTYSTGTLAIQVGNISQNGYISSSDWNTFNGKLSTSLTQNHFFVGNVSNVAADAGTNLLFSNSGSTYTLSVGTAASGNIGKISLGGSAANGEIDFLGGPGRIIGADSMDYVTTPTGRGHAFYTNTNNLKAVITNGRTIFYDTIQTPNISLKVLDTTSFKLVVVDASGNQFKSNWQVPGAGGGLTGGSGLSPLFTNGVSGSTLTFTASNAAANTAFGNFTGSSAPGAFGKLPLAAMATGTANTLIGYDGSGNPSGITVSTGLNLAGGVLTATGGGGPSAGNPTATIGYAIQNGSAATYMRSDASPLLDSNGQHPTAVTTQASRNKMGDSLSAKINAVYPNEGQVGEIFNTQTTFQNSLTNFGTPNPSGSATVTLSGGYPVITTTSTASWFNTITELPDRPTMLPLWSDTLEFQLLFTPGAGTTGMGPALISTQNTSPLSIKCYVNTSNSGNGNIVMATHAGVVLGSGGTGCTNTLNDVIRTVLTKVNDSTFTFQAFNLTTQVASTLATANFVTTLGGNLPPNIGNFGYVAFGSGNYRRLRRRIVSTAKRYPYVLSAFDSKGVSIGATKFFFGINNSLGRSFVSTTGYSGTGSTTADFLKLKQEALMMDPPYIVFGYGSNDIRFGTSLAQTESNIITAASWWKGTSTKFLITIFAEDSTAGGIGLTNLKNWMASSANQAAYGFTYIDCWTTLTGGSGNICVAPYINTDHIHLTDAGYAAVIPLISAAIGANPIRRASPRTYSPTLVPIGDSLTTTYSVTNRIGYLPVPDSNLNLVPSFFQQNGSQAGVSASGSYVPAFGSTFGVNGQIGTNGPAGGFSFYDRSVNPTFGSTYGLYSDKNLLRFFTNALSGRDFALMDSAGRIKFGNFTAGIQTVRPLAWVDVPASDGTAGHGSFIISPGVKLTVPVPGMFDNDSSANHIYWTDKLGTQYQLDRQTGGSGVSRISPLDSLAKSANGLQISGVNLVPQSADASFPGFVTTGSQTFAGAKIFNGQVTFPAATTGAASLLITASAAVNPTSPTSGQLWWNGTNLNFRTGSTTVDLLAGGYSPTLTYTQLVTTNTLALTGATTQTFLTATQSLAGLLDTGRAKSIDSIRNGIKTFNLFSVQGLKTYGNTSPVDSIGLGGSFYQPDTIATNGNSFLITGLPSKTTALSTDSLFLSDISGKIWKLAVPSGGGSGNTNSNVGSLFRLALPNTNNIKTIGSTGGTLLFDSTTTNQINISLNLGSSNTWTAAQSVNAVFSTNSTVNLTGLAYSAGGSTFDVLTQDTTTGKIWRQPYFSLDTTGFAAGKSGLAFNGTKFILSGNPITTVSFGSTPNSNGGAISGNVFTLQPADGSNPGGISTTTQSFAGDKTLTSTLSVTGGNAANPKLNITGNVTGNPSTSLGWLFNVSNATVTDNTSSGTFSSVSGFSRFGAPTLAASSATTYSNISTVLILGAPTAGTNATITNSYALQVFNGSTKLASNVFGGFYMGLYSPSFAGGVGAGSSPTVSIQGTRQDGVITVTTGTIPTASSVVGTLTYDASYAVPTGSYATLTPGNAITAALTGTTQVYTVGSTTGFTINSGTVGLVAATTYIWYYHVGGN